MSGPEGGVMTSSSDIDMRLVYNSDGTNIYHPIPRNSPPYHPGGGGAEGSAGMVSHGMNTNTNMNMGGGGSQPMKKKRGRPRKYGPDSSVSLSLPPPFVAAGAGGLSPPSQQQTVPAPVSAGGPASPPPTVKKGRGRPPGSANKRQQLQGLGSAGNGFTPHVITVQAGEDVSSKIMAFSQNGPRAICILSANGAISNVTLRQAATSGGTVTYEGRFEILSLSGSFLVSDFDGRRSRTGGLSVSLAGPNGRVLGGGVAGLLIAATPIQVVVGSFMPETEKETKEAHHPTEDLLVSKHAPGVGGGGGSGGTGGSSPPSHGTLSESSGGAASPLNHSTGACHNSAPPSRLSGFPWN